MPTTATSSECTAWCADATIPESRGSSAITPNEVSVATHNYHCVVSRNCCSPRALG
jgi:hypothetical protein